MEDTSYAVPLENQSPWYMRFARTMLRRLRPFLGWTVLLVLLMLTAMPAMAIWRSRVDPRRAHSEWPHACRSIGCSGLLAHCRLEATAMEPDSIEPEDRGYSTTGPDRRLSTFFRRIAALLCNRFGRAESALPTLAPCPVRRLAGCGLRSMGGTRAAGHDRLPASV